MFLNKCKFSSFLKYKTKPEHLLLENISTSVSPCISLAFSFLHLYYVRGIKP